MYIKNPIPKGVTGGSGTFPLTQALLDVVEMQNLFWELFRELSTGHFFGFLGCAYCRIVKLDVEKLLLFRIFEIVYPSSTLSK